jgi:uncharacterized protein (DUF697 family)
MTRIEEALNATLKYSGLAASACFGILSIVPIPGVDAIALTPITKTLCDKITRIYGYSSLSGMAMFTGVIIGAASGAKLAVSVTSVIPVIGAGANAVATATLHMVTGFALTITLDMLYEGSISEEYIRDSPVGFISGLMGVATDAVGNIARGYGPMDSILKAKSAMKALT